MSISSILTNCASVLPTSPLATSSVSNAASSFQSLLSQVQAKASGKAPTPAMTALGAASAKISQTAASQTSATGAALAHHHRHHVGGVTQGGSPVALIAQASADGAVASSTPVTAAAAASGDGPAAARDLAAAIQQALQSYGTPQSGGAAASRKI